MIDLLLEGVESAALPCSLILLVPGAAAALASRQESNSALAGFGLGSTTFAWLRFSDRGGELPSGVVALLLAGAVVALAVPLVRRLDIVSGTGGLMAGVAAGVLWVPCVSTEFGQLLTELPDRNASGVALLLIYMLGLFTPLLVLGAVLHLVPGGALLFARPVMLAVGAGTLAILALAAATDLTDSVIGRLVEWSVT